jgi:molecular chaperone IbpA
VFLVVKGRILNRLSFWEGILRDRSTEDLPMRHFDLAPLYRATIGFDQIADLINQVSDRSVNQPSYPPYNIEKTAEDAYRISIAVAGFATDDLSVEVKENELVIAARKTADEASNSYLHHGIAKRAFERRFKLADHVQVSAADHRDGMLHIDLTREVPEALKPRQIAIANAGPAALNQAAKAIN